MPAEPIYIHIERSSVCKRINDRHGALAAQIVCRPIPPYLLPSLTLREMAVYCHLHTAERSMCMYIQFTTA